MPGSRKRNAGRLACLGDGTYVEDTVIYTTQKVPGSSLARGRCQLH